MTTYPLIERNGPMEEEDNFSFVPQMAYLKTKDMLEILPIDKKTLIKLITSGEIRGSKVIHQYIVTRRDFIAYLKKIRLQGNQSQE